MARRRLTATVNTRLTKFLHGWLNTGRQKGLFGELSECPCCGWHEETQLHMFQCTSPDARRTRKATFKLLEGYYHEHKVPPLVYIPFLRMIKGTCDDEEITWRGRMPPQVRAAITKQSAMHSEFMLRGYLVTEWLSAIKAITPDKPDQKLVHLHLGLWTILFPSVWEQRNTINHGDTNIVTKIQRTQYILELKEWKRHAASRLGASQVYLIDYDIPTILTWTNTTMKETIALLGNAARNFRKAQLDKTQPRITQHFQIISRNRRGS